VKFLKAVCEKENIPWTKCICGDEKCSKECTEPTDDFKEAIEGLEKHKKQPKERANTLRELIGGKQSVEWKDPQEVLKEAKPYIDKEIEKTEAEAITKGLDDLYGVNEEKEFPSTERCPHCKKCSRDYFTKEEIDEKIKELDDFDSEMLRCLSIFREHEKSKVQEEEKEWRKKILEILRKICVSSEPQQPASAFKLGEARGEIDILLKELE
ncbi:MAG: hypothetical protein QQN63_03115, partial [Nitrosopumilus sp.]